MAERDLDSIRTVIEQVPLQRQAQTVAAPNVGFNQLVQSAAEIGQQVIKRSVDAKIVQDLSQAQLDIMKLKNDIAVQYESDPSAGFDAFQKGSKKILDDYKNGIPAFFQGQFREKAMPLAQQASLTMQSWQIAQSRKNTINSVNQTIKNDLKVAQMAGINYAQSQDGAIDGLLQFGLQRQRLEAFAAENLGAETAKELLRTYDEDYAKMFALGVISENPIKALELFKTEEFQQSISDPTIKQELEKAAQSNILQMVQKADMERLVGEITNNTQVLQKRMAGDLSYMEVVLLESEGKISPAIAKFLKKDLTVPEEYETEQAIQKGVRQGLIREEVLQRLEARIPEDVRREKAIQEKVEKTLINAEAKIRANQAMGIPPDIDDVQKFERTAQLNAALFDIIEKTDGRITAKSGTTMNDFLQFQNEVAVAVANGEITRAQANSYINKVFPIVQEWIEDSSSFFGTDKRKQIRNSAFSEAYKATIDYIEATPIIDNAYSKVRAFQMVADAVANDKQLPLLEGKAAIERQKEIANQVLDSFVRETFPKLAGAKKLPDAVRTANGVVRLPQGLTEKPQARPMQIAAPPIRDKYFDRNGNIVEMSRIEALAQQENVSVQEMLIELIAIGEIR